MDSECCTLSNDILIELLYRTLQHLKVRTHTAKGESHSLYNQEASNGNENSLGTCSFSERWKIVWFIMYRLSSSCCIVLHLYSTNRFATEMAARVDLGDLGPLSYSLFWLLAFEFTNKWCSGVLKLSSLDREASHRSDPTDHRWHSFVSSAFKFAPVADSFIEP